MSNILKINISTLENYQNEFNNEFNNFKNSANSTFENGYLNSCSDSIVRSMCSGLQSYYSRIEKGYTNINNWWLSYINNVYNLENFLAGNCGTGGIDDPATLSAIGYLFNLEGYDNIIEDTFSVNSDPYSSTFSFDDPTLLANWTGEQNQLDEATTASVEDFAKKYLSKLTDSCVDIYNEDGTINVVNVLRDFGTVYLNYKKMMYSTGATAALGFAEGVLDTGEDLLDAGLVVTTGLCSIGTGATDLFNYLKSKVTGEKYESVTKRMWEETKAIVAKDHVGTWFDNLYNTDVGKIIKDNSIEYDSVRNISKGFGKTASAFTLSALTGGVISPAAFSGLSKFGESVESAWADGADTVGGLLYGAGKGAWETIQFSVGKWADGNKLLSTGAKALIDAGTGTVESLLDPIFKLTYKNGYYDKNGNYVEFTANDSFADRYNKFFEENGGVRNVVEQTVIAGGMSLIGEAVDRLLKKMSGKKPDVDKSAPDGKDLSKNPRVLDAEYEVLGDEMPETVPIGSSSASRKQAGKKYFSDVEGVLSGDIKITKDNFEEYANTYNKLLTFKNSREYAESFGSVADALNNKELMDFEYNLKKLEYYIVDFANNSNYASSFNANYLGSVTMQVGDPGYLKQMEMKVFKSSDGTIFYEQADIDHSAMSAKVISEEVEKIKRRVGVNYTSATKEFRITTIKNPTDLYWSKITNREFNSMCTAGGGLVNIWNPAATHLYLGDLDEYLVHEMGHNFDGKNFGLSNSDWWSNAVRNDGNFATAYAKESYETRSTNRFAEDLADSLRNLYKMGEDNFKKQFPNRFEIIKSIFK